jgi:UDP-N-acetylmuramyl pentapeptide phosphotransferase/UDP-N-acetylglucosamine-1-phosphate transferase
MRGIVLLGAVVAGAACGLAGAALTLQRARRGAVPIDLPNERRLHTAPTPRGGGVGIPFVSLLAALAAFWAPISQPVTALALVWALPNGVLGWVDDRWPMRSRTKFAIQALAAIAVTPWLLVSALTFPFVGTVPLGLAARPFTVLWLVWMANLFNFMDGLDALAGGCGLLFFLGFAALPGGCPPSLLALLGAGAMAGFLRYNWPPAKIFMGDSGSLFTGAALAGLAVSESRPGCGVPFAASILLLGPFVWDATYTIAWRALEGQAMRPHRTHLYQRMVLAGWSRAAVRGLYFGLTVLSVAAALVYPRVRSAGQLALLAGAVGAGVVLVLLTRRVERARARAGRPSGEPVIQSAP